jgi:hypothetical protein
VDHLVRPISLVWHLPGLLFTIFGNIHLDQKLPVTSLRQRNVRCAAEVGADAEPHSVFDCLEERVPQLTLPAVTIAASLAYLATMQPAAARDQQMRMACAAASAAQIEGWFNDFNAAWASKDLAKVTNLFTKDAVLLATV